MKKGKALVLMLVFLTLMVPGALWAGDGKNAFVVLKGGGYFPTSSDLRDQDAKSGYIGQVGLGYYLLDIFSVELAGGYSEVKGTLPNTSTDTKLSLYPLELAGRLGFHLLFFEPYIKAGVGGYYVKATAGNQSETNWRGGYFGGAGINFNFGRIFLGVEGRYQILKAPAPAPTSSNPSATTDVNMDGVVVTGNIGFRF